jgi:UDP-glucose 4-epimerase
MVTGGAGFIGSHLVDSLLMLRCEVIAYDVFDDFYPGKEANVIPNQSNRHYRLIEGDILDFPRLREAMKGVSIVFHEAAQAGVRYCIENPRKADEVNVRGTMNVLMAARENEVRKIVYASSSSVYGKPIKVPLSEDDPTRPTNPYGVSKLAGENYCISFHETYKTPVACVRYFSVYGPRGRPDQVVSAFARSAVEGKRPTIYGDGRQSRDFTYVADIVSGTILAAMADESIGEVINLGYGKEISILDVAEKVIERLGVDLEPTFKKGYDGDFPRTLCNNDKAEKILRWKPQVGFDEGIEHFLDWFERTRIKTLPIPSGAVSRN